MKVSARMTLILTISNARIKRYQLHLVMTAGYRRLRGREGGSKRKWVTKNKSEVVYIPSERRLDGKSVGWSAVFQTRSQDQGKVTDMEAWMRSLAVKGGVLGWSQKIRP